MVSAIPAAQPSVADGRGSKPLNASADRSFLPLVGFIIVFCTIESVAMAGLYAFARSGLETDSTAIFGLLPMAVAVMAVSFIPLRMFAGSYLAPLLMTLAVTAMLLVPLVGGSTGLWLLLPLGAVAAAGLGTGAASSWRLIRAHPFTLILGAPAFALVRFIAVNGGQMTHIYAPEFMLLGQPYLDTSFHAALTEMLRNFGIVSVGLDGLAPQFHHIGSHLWLGSVASIFDLPAIDLYPMAFQIFAVPCFTFFFLLAVAYLQRANLRQPVMLIVAALIVSFISSWFFLDKLLLSESYLFALIVFLSAVPLLFVLLSREEPSIAASILCLGAAGFLAVVLFTLKVPAGVMWAAAVAVVLVRRATGPRWRNTVLAMIALTAVGAGLILLVVGLMSSRSLWSFVSPFDFAGGSKKYFLSDLAIIALVAIMVTLSRFNGSYGRGEAAGLLGILLVLGALPGSIFALSNSAYYFANIVAWLALVLAAGQLAYLLESSAERRRLVGTGAIVLLILVVGADPDRYKRLSIYLQRVAVLQEFGRDGEVVEWPRKRSLSQSLAVIGDAGSSIVTRAAHLEALFPDNVSAALEKTPGAMFVRQVKDARAASPAPLAVFVPPDDLTFWTLNRDCRAQPFFIPALTGVPMILGLHPHGRALHCVLDSTYGFGQYGNSSHSIRLEPEAICAQARARGFERVLILESPNPSAGNRIVVCSP